MEKINDEDLKKIDGGYGGGKWVNATCPYCGNKLKIWYMKCRADFKTNKAAMAYKNHLKLLRGNNVSFRMAGNTGNGAPIGYYFDVDSHFLRQHKSDCPWQTRVGDPSFLGEINDGM